MSIRFKNKLKTYRERQGITLNELSKRTRIPVSTLYTMEEKGSFPREATRIKLQEALGCNWSDIFYEVREVA